MKDTQINFTKREFSELTGAGYDSVCKWLKKGLPHSKRNGKVIINRVQAAEWFADPTRRLTKYVFKLAPRTEPAEIQTIFPKAGDTVQQFTSMIARAREVEEASFRAWQNSSPALKGLMEEQYMKSADQRRKIEKDWPSIQIAAGDALPRSMVETELGEILTMLKQKLRGIAQNVAVMVEGKKPAETKAIIGGRIDDAIRDCADALGKMK